MQATFETWIRDFRHAARSLVRAPGFTLTVVATCAPSVLKKEGVAWVRKSWSTCPSARVVEEPVP